MVLFLGRLRILLAVGAISVGGIVLYKLLKKKKRRSLLWRGTPIHVCSTTKDWVKYEEHFLDAMYKAEVIGLDCEWVNEGGKRLPVSLLQIATSSDICIVFRMTNLMKEPSLPATLIHLLEDSSILKVGVEISEDVRKLHNDYGITVKGFCDLRFIADSIPDFQDVETKSLKDMARNIAGIEISKSSRLRCSNWEAKTLTEEQISYAAGDAVVAACIFDALEEKICSKRFIRKPFKVSSLMNEQHLLIAKFIDVPYSSTVRMRSPSRVIPQSTFTQKKKSEKQYATVRQRPLYDNCILVAPDGGQLCTCKVKKIWWYVDRGLGDIISEDPLTLQLKFEPAERPILDKEYYIYEKDNCCVVCGSTKRLLKKCVVPTEYKRFFPEMMRSHLSHDILLLCVSCHRRSNTCDLTLRQQLAKECCAPLGSARNVRIKEQPELQKVRSAARAILRNKEKIPSQRLEVLEKTVKDFYNITELTANVLLMASDMQTSTINEEYVTHGERVVDYMSLHGGLLAFESRWRQHFLDTMNPLYLPKMWSVTHSNEYLALKVVEGNIDFDPGILGLSEEQLEAAVLNKYLFDGLRSASMSV